MVTTLNITNLSDCGNYTFVEAKAPDFEVRFMFRKDDPRIQDFAFRGELMLEVNQTVTTPLRLVETAR